MGTFLSFLKSQVNTNKTGIESSVFRMVSIETLFEDKISRSLID
jgi:hypothetical protein